MAEFQVGEIWEKMNRELGLGFIKVSPPKKPTKIVSPPSEEWKYVNIQKGEGEARKGERAEGI